MSENLITLDQIRDLVKLEKIKPEQIFDEEGLKEIRDKAKAEGYAEGSFKQAWDENREKIKEAAEKDKSNQEDRYIDPGQNPMIKTDEG